MENIITKKHKGPPLGYVALTFTLLFCTGLSFVISLKGIPPYFPGPWESAATIVRYFQNHPHDVLLCAFLQFCSSIPLGIFTATVASRLIFLGSTAAGNNITLFGGFLTVFNLALSSMLMWVMAYPDIAADENIIRTLYYAVFIIGGVGYSVPMGLLIAGISVTSWFMKTLPKWLAISGIVLALIGEASSFYMVSPKLLFLIPLTRFPGFIWLIIIGFKLPKSKKQETS
jgi:hypothetical protein